MATRTPRPVRLDGVLVVGGGYAGLHAARTAAGDGVPVTVLDPDGRHDFVTRLAAVAGRTASRRDASTPIAALGHEVLVGRVAAVADGSVELDDGRRVEADAVVLCLGSAPTRPDIDGIDLAHVLRTADDALALRAELDEADAVTIVGGGATGVQLAGALGASGLVGDVRIVEMEERLLPTMTEASSTGAERILRDRGVRVMTSAGVERITADGAHVDGEVLDGIVVWAGGFVPRTDGLDLPLADDGRIRIDAALRVEGMQRVFAAGDVADHRDAAGDPLPMSAQIAVQAGEGAGRNAARTVRGEDAEPVDLGHRGWVLDLSGRRGIAELGGVSFAEPFADLVPPLLHEAIDIKTRFGIGGLAALTC